MTDARVVDLQRSTMPSVTIYSDGSFKYDLGTGGYGSIMTCGSYCRFFDGGFSGGSNNSMELMAVIVPLRLLNQPCKVNVISDSQYVVKGINGWMHGWVLNEWKKSDGMKIANVDLWRELYNYSQYHVLSATWIKGHAGNFSNAVCDQFATIGAYKTANVSIPPELLSINRL